MRPAILTATLLSLSLSALACGRPFDVKTPTGFVELDDQAPSYDYRSTTPDGLVTSVRAIDMDDKGDLAFWVQAVTLRMRDVSGYALLSSDDLVSADGTKGKRLMFGHDEGSKPYLYQATLFWTPSRLFLLEAGGTKDQMARHAATLDWQGKTFHARCRSWLAPVLASYTCNRW